MLFALRSTHNARAHTHTHRVCRTYNFFALNCVVHIVTTGPYILMHFLQNQDECCTKCLIYVVAFCVMKSSGDSLSKELSYTNRTTSEKHQVFVMSAILVEGKQLEAYRGHM